MRVGDVLYAMYAQQVAEDGKRFVCTIIYQRTQQLTVHA